MEVAGLNTPSEYEVPLETIPVVYEEILPSLALVPNKCYNKLDFNTQHLKKSKEQYQNEGFGSPSQSSNKDAHNTAAVKKYSLLQLTTDTHDVSSSGCVGSSRVGEEGNDDIYY